MQRASDKAYISKKEMELYQRERARILREARGEEMKDDELEKLDEAELSAEEVDSDDLGDDITQKKKKAPVSELVQQQTGFFGMPSEQQVLEQKQNNATQV